MTQPVPATPSTTSEPSRRGFLYRAVTATIAGIVGIFPAISGLLFFLDPLRRSNALGGFIKVGQLDAVPDDGSPVRFTVVVHRLEDAWTTYLNVPVGAVYVRKDAAKKVIAFNVTCPHLGCAVDYMPGRNEYLCPCHDSAFKVDGTRMNQTPPRDMDTLDVDAEKLKIGEVWVRYQDFRTGEEHKVAKT